jgi:hypothetical protein
MSTSSDKTPSTIYKSQNSDPSAQILEIVGHHPHIHRKIINQKIAYAHIEPAHNE